MINATDITNRPEPLSYHYMSVNEIRSETVTPSPSPRATEKGESALITVNFFLGGGSQRVIFSCAQITIGDMLCRGGPRHIQLETW